MSAVKSGSTRWALRRGPALLRGGGAVRRRGSLWAPPWQLLAVVALLASGCGGTFRIHERPIPFSDWRQQATRAYIAEHYGRQVDSITIEPRIIVLHWTASDSLEESLSRFEPEGLPARRADLGGTGKAGAGQVNVSAHFLVDRDGKIFRLMPETWMARHVIGLNLSAIGIENVGGEGGVDNLTRRQIKANIRLVRDLKARFPSIGYLIAHSEYRQLEGHPLWLELDPGYRTEKIDPGERVMKKVRRAVADLGLEGVEDVPTEGPIVGRSEGDSRETPSDGI